jgi:hypothetical protein
MMHEKEENALQFANALRFSPLSQEYNRLTGIKKEHNVGLYKGCDKKQTALGFLSYVHFYFRKLNLRIRIIEDYCTRLPKFKNLQ